MVEVVPCYGGISLKISFGKFIDIPHMVSSQKVIHGLVLHRTAHA
jgi:hypothetical protein